MNTAGQPEMLPASADAGTTLTEEQGRAAMAKVTWRLIPLLFFCYIIAYIDRINVGFAKLHLREVLGVDPAVFGSVYGFGAGLFFIGYFFFEVPSNLILQRVGARIWIARIMVVWGLVSMGFMFLKGTSMFYMMRFLLGAAEAGFFPGVILYLTYWYPARERARTVAMFATGGVLAGVIGNPISGALLTMDGFSLGPWPLAGWQWLFFIEAIPAVLMGLVVLWVLPNKPQDARWLSAAEKKWITDRINAETAARPATERHRLSDVMTNRRVWLFCLLYLLMNIGGYGYEMWLPSITQALTEKGTAVLGLINAIPYFVAGIAMILVARYSDRSGERRKVVALAAATSTVGFAASAYFKDPYLAMAALTLAFVGLKCTIAPFWAMTTSYLSTAAAAAGIALINSVGNLGGFIGPYAVGLFKDATKSDVAALLLLGAALLGMALLTLTVPKQKATPAAG